jgi:hypothetical protein
MKMELLRLLATKNVRMEADERVRRALTFYPDKPEAFLRGKLTVNRGFGHWLAIKLALAEIRRSQPPTR